MASDEDISHWLLKGTASEEDFFLLSKINNKVNKIKSSYDNLFSIYVFNKKTSKFISNFHGYKDATGMPFRGWEYAFAEEISYSTVVNTRDADLFTPPYRRMDTLSFIRSAPSNKNQGAIIINVREDLFSSYYTPSKGEITFSMRGSRT